MNRQAKLAETVENDTKRGITIVPAVASQEIISRGD